MEKACLAELCGRYIAAKKWREGNERTNEPLPAGVSIFSISFRSLSLSCVLMPQSCDTFCGNCASHSGGFWRSFYFIWWGQQDLWCSYWSTTNWHLKYSVKGSRFCWGWLCLIDVLMKVGASSWSTEKKINHLWLPSKQFFNVTHEFHFLNLWSRGFCSKICPSKIEIWWKSTRHF